MIGNSCRHSCSPQCNVCANLINVAIVHLGLLKKRSTMSCLARNPTMYRPSLLFIRSSSSASCASLLTSGMMSSTRSNSWPFLMAMLCSIQQATTRHDTASGELITYPELASRQLQKKGHYLY